MIPRVVRASLLLTSAFALVIGVIRGRPYDDRGMGIFLLGCAMPCWQGIRPRVTSPEEAMTILQSLDTVRNVGANLDAHGGQIYWLWSATRPPFLHETHEVGYLWIQGDQITNMYLPGFESFLDTLLTLGRPQQVRVYFNSLWGTRTIIYLLIYPNELYAAHAVHCSAGRAELMRAPSAVYIGAPPQYPGLDSFTVRPDDLAGWMPQRLC